MRRISQRELRNDAASVLRDVQHGETLIVTRNGTPIAELRPVAPRRFVPRAVIAEAAAARRGSMPAGSALTSTPGSTSLSMADVVPSRGLLDTSVVIDHDIVDPELLPDESAVAAVTVAELAAGPHATGDSEERSRRIDRLQWAAITWDPLPFDADAARAYGRVYTATLGAGRSTRARFADLFIAATAAANALPVYTRNPADLEHLEPVVRVVGV